MLRVSKSSRRKICSCVLLLGFLVTCPRAHGAPLDVSEEVVAAEARRVAAIAKASEATIAVFEANKAGGGGSGVVISADGYALTNFHVTQPCGHHMSCGMNTGEIYDAVLVGIDPTGDLALIKLLGRDDFPTATIADSDSVLVGDECFAVGNPFLLATDMTPTVTYGVVSGVRRYQPPAGSGILEYTDCIQTDAAINPGNSGGPLFNASGDLIGINGRGSFEKRGRVNVGVGYAISINQAVNFIGVLRSGRVVDHATLGATVSTNDDGTVVVTNILGSSDAYRRGLRYGDQIVTLADRTIDSANTFKNVLGILPRGWRVPLTFRRDGESFDIFVRLAGVHSPEILWRLSQAGGPQRPPDGRPPDGQRPQDGKPNDDHDDEAPPERQDKDSPGRSAADVSREKANTEVSKRFEARRGFANFYFNRIEKQRVWGAFTAAHQIELTPTTPHATWEMQFTLADGDQLAVQLDDATARIKRTGAQQEELVVDMTTNLATMRQPEGSGGLYLALYLLRRLMVLGPDQFGEVIYWGTAPLPHRTAKYDVFLATHDVVESRFYFAPDSGQMRALEMFPDSEVDPCELEFDDFRPTEGGPTLAHRITVRFGDAVYTTLTLESVRYSQPTNAPPVDAQPADGGDAS